MQAYRPSEVAHTGTARFAMPACRGVHNQLLRRVGGHTCEHGFVVSAHGHTYVPVFPSGVCTRMFIFVMYEGCVCVVCVCDCVRGCVDVLDLCVRENVCVSVRVCERMRVICLICASMHARMVPCVPIPRDRHLQSRTARQIWPIALEPLEAEKMRFKTMTRRQEIGTPEASCQARLRLIHPLPLCST